VYHIKKNDNQNKLNSDLLKVFFKELKILKLKIKSIKWQRRSMPIPALPMRMRITRNELNSSL